MDLLPELPACAGAGLTDSRAAGASRYRIDHQQDHMSEPTPPAPPPAAPAASNSPAAPAAAPATPATVVPPAAPRRQWTSFAAFGAVALAGVLVVLYAWRLPPFSSSIVATENALVRGQVTLIGSQLSGYVTAVNVQDFQYVKKGELLVQIDDRTYLQRYAQARATLAAQKAALANWAQQRSSAQASIALAEAAVPNAAAQSLRTHADLGRIDQLVADGSLSVREQDAARAARAQSVAAQAQARANVQIAKENLRAVTVNRDALEAAVANADAALLAAKVDLDNTRVTAPEDGQLGQVTVRQGAYVNSGGQLMGLVPRQLWVIANFKETQMNGVRVGQRASFHVDALDGAVLRGQVERISPATGSEFSVLPPDNATGNYVKIAQRIPVRISIDADQQNLRRLGPGMSVVVSIDTSLPPQTREQERAARSTP
jgi:multidrug resistance efflux pump